MDRHWIKKPCQNQLWEIPWYQIQDDVLKAKQVALNYQHVIDIQYTTLQYYLDGLVQERPNSIVNALELRLSCTNPSLYTVYSSAIGQ